MKADIAGQLARLGMKLPPPPSPRGAYVGVSGQVSRVGDEIIAGPVGADTPPDVIRRAAQTCVLRAMSALVAAMPATMTVDRILFLRGFVHAVPGYVKYSEVMDEASALLLEIFGENGRHARSAVGVSGLPSDTNPPSVPSLSGAAV